MSSRSQRLAAQRAPSWAVRSHAPLQRWLPQQLESLQVEPQQVAAAQRRSIVRRMREQPRRERAPCKAPTRQALARPQSSQPCAAAAMPASAMAERRTWSERWAPHEPAPMAHRRTWCASGRRAQARHCHTALVTVPTWLQSPRPTSRTRLVRPSVGMDGADGVRGACYAHIPYLGSHALGWADSMRACVHGIMRPG